MQAKNIIILNSDFNNGISKDLENEDEYLINLLEIQNRKIKLIFKMPVQFSNINQLDKL